MPQWQDRAGPASAIHAARLIAEEGISDYSQAKRKAATPAGGLPESTPLPSNAEVEAALREWQAVFQDEEQIERIAHLRRKAAELMDILRGISALI